MNRRYFLRGAVAVAVVPMLPTPAVAAPGWQVLPTVADLNIRWANVTMTASEVAERWNCLRAKFDPYVDRLLEPFVRQAVDAVDEAMR